MTRKLRPHYLVRVLDATSQWLNTALLNGDPNESISGRSYREGWLLEHLIDTIFFWELDHCMNAYLADVARARNIVERSSKNG